MDNVKQLDFLAAEQNRDLGIQSSLDHANREVDHWSEKAMAMLKEFIFFQRDEPFMAEDVRKYAHAHGLEEPPSNRAWGGVIVRASKNGIIHQIGFGLTKNPLSHRTPANLWKKS